MSKMKKFSKITVLMLVLLMALAPALSACGSKAEPDDGQNPIMNFVGVYGCGRATLVIGATDEENGVNASITWGSSAAENSVWTMSGTFDTETLTFEYNDGERIDYVYNENGEVESETSVYKDGHGTMTFTEGDPLTLTWKDDVEDAGKDMVFEYASAAPDGIIDGMANPWSEAASLEEAAAGAGLDGFSIPEGAEISLGAIEPSVFRYMDGMAETKVEFPAVEMTIRKGLASKADVGEGDISGDYNEYANTWTQNIKGLEVTCFGNREGEATKTIWQVDDTCWSINVLGLGGDTDYGLSADDLSSLINGIQ